MEAARSTIQPLQKLDEFINFMAEGKERLKQKHIFSLYLYCSKVWFCFVGYIYSVKVSIYQNQTHAACAKKFVHISLMKIRVICFEFKLCHKAMTR